MELYAAAKGGGAQWRGTGEADPAAILAALASTSKGAAMGLMYRARTEPDEKADENQSEHQESARSPEEAAYRVTDILVCVHR